MSEEQVVEEISQGAQPEETPSSAAPERDEQGRFQKKNSAQERIDQLTARMREQERRAMIAESQLQSIMDERNRPEPPAPLVEPKPEQFQTYEEYIDARSEFVAERKMREFNEKQIERSDQSNRIAMKAEFDRRGQEFAEEHPDYQQAVASIPGDWLPQDVADLIMRSEQGPQIAYHLAQNPQEAFRISRLGPSQRAYEIGRINTDLTGRKTSSTPPPLEPVKPGDEGPSDWRNDPNISTQEWAKRRNEELAKKRKR